MADKERIEPTISDVQAPAAQPHEPVVVEPTIADVVEKVEALEAAGQKPNEFDGSEADKAYQAKVETLVMAAHAQIEKTDQEAQELLAISQRAIKPQEGTPYDTYGEPLDLDVASDMRLAQIALQNEETAKKFFDRFVERVGKKHAATITPLAMGNVSLLLSPENIADVKAVAPQYFTEAYSQDLADSGKSLLEKAGFSPEVIGRLDANFLRYMGATQQHEAAFPVEGPGVDERVKEPGFKSMVLDALGNKNVQRSLKWAGLAVSCATGGIVVKAGMSGAKFLAGKLVENENVRAFAAKLEDRSISFVSDKFNLDEAKIRKNVEKTKGSVESIFRNKWVGLATGVAVMGIAIGLGQIDAVHDVAKDVAGRFIELPYSVVEAVSDTRNGTLDFLGTHTIDGYSEMVAIDEKDIPAVPTDIAHPGVAASAEAAVAQAAAPIGVDVPAPAAVDVSAPASTSGDVTASASAPAATTSAYVDGQFSAARSGLTSNIAPEVRYPGAPDVSTGAPEVVAVTPGVSVEPVGAAVTDAPAAPGVVETASPAVGNTEHVVKVNDTVSHIAQRELEARGLPATRENIYKFVDQIYEHNKSVIGPDVNKIFPGQTISLAFEPQNLNLGHHAAAVVSAPAPQVLDVSASRVSPLVSDAALRSVLGVTKDQMLASTGLDALNPVPKIEESVHLAAALRTDPDTAIVSVPAPTKPLVPNLAFAGSSSVSQHADIQQGVSDYFAEEKPRVAAELEDKKPARWHDADEGYGIGKG